MDAKLSLGRWFGAAQLTRNWQFDDAHIKQWLAEAECTAQQSQFWMRLVLINVWLVVGLVMHTKLYCLYKSDFTFKKKRITFLNWFN